MSADTCEPAVVHANVFDPSGPTLFKTSKNDRPECQWIECSLVDCPLRASGHCTMGGVFGTKCPYGTYRRESGPTQRAGSFRSWVNERKERIKGVPYLDRPATKLAFIGDWVYLPYSHMTMCKDVPFNSHDAFIISGNCFLPATEWTVDNVERLVRFRPRAMMGGEITQYQKEQVPLFVQHLRELDPAMFGQLVERMPELDTEPDYVGRQAVITTLNHPIQWTEKGHYPVQWEWDGTRMRSTSQHAYNNTWGNVKAESVAVEIVPKEGQSIEVRSNEWVNSGTVFAD